MDSGVNQCDVGFHQNAQGLFRKGGELLVVVLAFVTEYALEVAAHAHIATFASVYIIVMESLSVLENLDQARRADSAHYQRQIRQGQTRA